MPRHILAPILIALVITFVDIYIRTYKPKIEELARARAILKSLGFYILLLAQGLFAWAAASLVYLKVDPDPAWTLPIALGIAFGSFGIVQNFALTLGGKGPDFREWFEIGKDAIVTQVKANLANAQEKEAQKLAKLLAGTIAEDRLLRGWADIHQMRGMNPPVLKGHPAGMTVAYFIIQRNIDYARSLLPAPSPEITKGVVFARWSVYLLCIFIALAIVWWRVPSQAFLWRGVSWQTILLGVVALVGSGLPALRHRSKST